MVRIEFAAIDARDDAYTQYQTVGFVDLDHDEPASLSPQNGRIAVLMEREYLTRLYSLQQEIAAKYLPQWTDDDIILPDELVYGQGMNKRQYDEAYKEAEELFPGREATYRD